MADELVTKGYRCSCGQEFSKLPSNYYSNGGWGGIIDFDSREHRGHTMSETEIYQRCDCWGGWCKRSGLTTNPPHKTILLTVVVAGSSLRIP